MNPKAQIKTIFFLAIFIFLLPFLGFPGSWKTVLLVIIGALIAYLSFTLYKLFSPISVVKEKSHASIFVESHNHEHLNTVTKASHDDSQKI